MNIFELLTVLAIPLCAFIGFSLMSPHGMAVGISAGVLCAVAGRFIGPILGLLFLLPFEAIARIGRFLGIGFFTDPAESEQLPPAAPPPHVTVEKELRRLRTTSRFGLFVGVPLLLISLPLFWFFVSSVLEPNSKHTNKEIGFFIFGVMCLFAGLSACISSIASTIRYHKARPMRADYINEP